MAIGEAGQFKGNEHEASKFLKGKLGRDAPQGAVRYLAYGDTNLSTEDRSVLGLGGYGNDYRGGGGGGGGQPQGGGMSNEQMAQQLVQQQQSQYEQARKFQEPALETLRQSGEGIGERYERRGETIEAERAPLTQRYDNLLKSITQGTRTAAASEFSKRGIPLSSGLVEQTVGARLAPQIERVGLDREAGLRDLTAMQSELTGRQSEEEQMLQQAIASIQSQTGQTGIQAGLSAYQQAQQVAQQQANRDLSRWQTNQQQAMQQQQMGFQQEQFGWQQQQADRDYQFKQQQYQDNLNKQMTATSDDNLDIDGIFKDWKEGTGWGGGNNNANQPNQQGSSQEAQNRILRSIMGGR